MRTRSLRTVGILFAAAVCLHLPVLADAAERFTFARPPAPESTVDSKSGRLDVIVDRWATDSERDQVLMTLKEHGPNQLLDAFRGVSRAGTLFWPGGLEYTVRYARQSARPDGTSDVVLIVDRPLWMWWEPNGSSPTGQYSIVQLRIDKNGSGEGRISRGVEVRGDGALGVSLDNYGQAPVGLRDVRKEQQGTK